VIYTRTCRFMTSCSDSNDRRCNCSFSRILLSDSIFLSTVSDGVSDDVTSGGHRDCPYA